VLRQNVRAHPERADLVDQRTREQARNDTRILTSVEAAQDVEHHDLLPPNDAHRVQK
jgi:hypothetical protein